MAICADYHLHSSFSGDSDTPMEDMIKEAIRLGLKQICFTEHQDFDYPPTPDISADFFLVNTDSYLYDLLGFKEKYAKQIDIRFGIELGLQPHLMRQQAVYVKSYDFDFVIGSSHICERMDPYYPTFYEDRSEEEAYRSYFSSILENIKKFKNFDVYGHLDYVVRYGPNKDREYTYEKYRDIFDAILSLLLENEKGIELNTGGLKYGLKEANPCMGILRRYREMGGELITVGSDAHEPAHIAYSFEKAADMLKECGFSYYATFQNRLPEYHKL